ncbi:MAG: DUF1311 domain-containing protein [Betaproteobacteria bacterium]|nr:DUF1311 domain-containing protein [Betaproteobacteria bacterium]
MLLLATLSIACVPHAASAGAAGSSKQFAACIDKSGGVTSSTIECIVTENKLQDDRLNKAYKALSADLQPARKTQLLEAQRAWIKFRDTNCSFYADPDGGSMARVSANDCVMRATTERARELEALKQ